MGLVKVQAADAASSWRARRGLFLALLVGVLGLPHVATAAVVRGPGGQPISITIKPAMAGALTRADGATPSLSYHGGPVLHSSAPFVVFWDPNGAIPASSRALVSRYFSDVAQGSGAGSNVYAVARQYTDSTGFASNQQGFDPGRQVLLDGQPFPTSGCAAVPAGATRCVTDGQIEDELSRLIQARSLPTGALITAPIYFVVLPPSVNECISHSDCASQDYCGYHTYMGANDGGNVLYAVIPMISLMPQENPKDCQWDGNGKLQEPNHDLMDGLIPTFSHEDIETITDPLMNAWYAPGFVEAGDMCSARGGDNPL